MNQTNEDIISYGYQHPKEIDGKWYAIHRMIFTTGVFFNITEHRNDGRLCFSTYADAIRFLTEWDGTNESIPNVGEDGLTANKL